MAVRRLHHGRCILLIPYVRRNKYLHSLNKSTEENSIESLGFVWLYAFVLIAFEGGGDGINTVFAGY